MANGASTVARNAHQRIPAKRPLSNQCSPSSATVTSSTVTPPPFSSDSGSLSLHNQFQHVSRNGAVQLQIITQPEQQHRARYQTEGSRGAVKDRSGQTFPVVKLNGYNRPTTLQVGVVTLEAFDYH